MKYPMTWNLDSIYAGGSESVPFLEELNDIENNISLLQQLLKEGLDRADSLLNATQLLQNILKSIREAESFVSCLMAQDMKDIKATTLDHRVKTLLSGYNTVSTMFGNALGNIEESKWHEYLDQHTELKTVAFNLNERRETAKLKMSPELEALAGDLAIDGYHGWGDFYNTIVGRMEFESRNQSGELEKLSAGQMSNRLSDNDRSKRAAAFEEWEKVWGQHAYLFAETLNRLAGYRLKLYEHRGWDSFLFEPLHMNRMSKETLDAMWSAVEKGKQLLKPYFERKAKLFNVEKLDWHDVEAPLASASTVISYDEAATFIVDKFRSFSPELADFAEMAFKEGWIEAEDRSGKRPGGFCTSFPKSEQTRIFMTYSGTPSNVSTLAHELGHAFHQHVMNDMPPFTQEYAMNVAETASTFAEMIVSDQALKVAQSHEEKLSLVEDKIQRAVAFYMNIHARFIFETQFYEMRRQGPLSSEQLNQLMIQAQQEAFHGMLNEVHPHFWAAKLHFFLTDVPFYNFPYTFGYLFSSGLYARAMEEGAAFAERYVGLLRDTGQLTVEQLAEKHLNVDLTKPEFWDDAVSLVKEDIELFVKLTE